MFHLFFILITYCIVYPPKEFISTGLTINQICLKLFGYSSEELEFIQHHQKRTIITLAIHTFIPFIYIGLYNLNYYDSSYQYPNIVLYIAWQCFVLCAYLVPLFGAGLALYWHLRDCENHPLTKNLKKFTNTGRKWNEVATSINDEFRRYKYLFVNY